MIADPRDQRRLLEVAALDERIRRVEATRRHPPQDAALAEVSARASARSAELARCQSEADAAVAELARIEADVAVVQARRRRDDGLLSGTTAAKDAIGLQHELVSLGNRLRDLEDAQLEAMQAAEDAAAAVAEQERALAEDLAARVDLESARRAALREAERELTELSSTRSAVTAAIPGPVLDLYQRLAARGPGAAELVGPTCGGCHMVLSGTDLNAIRQSPSDLIVTCPECGCILVRGDESQAAAR